MKFTISTLSHVVAQVLIRSVGYNIQLCDNNMVPDYGQISEESSYSFTCNLHGVCGVAVESLTSRWSQTFCCMKNTFSVLTELPFVSRITYAVSIGWIIEGHIIKHHCTTVHTHVYISLVPKPSASHGIKMSGGLIRYLKCRMTNEILQCIIKHCYITKVQWLPSITLRFVIW